MRHHHRKEQLEIAAREALVATGAIAVGAGLMYLLDPDRGRRRRSLMRDKFIHVGHRARIAGYKTGKYMSGQARGLAARARSAFAGDRPSDPQIVARVRSAMGRAVSHPGSIQVLCDNGVVTLRGPVLRDEHEHLLWTVWSVRGVCDLRDELEPYTHKQARDEPGLQGLSPRPHRLGLMREHWSPTSRTLMGLLGASLGVWGMACRDAVGIAAALLGGGIMARSLTNLATKRLVGVGAGRRAVEVQKTININAPVEKVFEFWSDYRNFPHFMRYVREVRDHGDGRSHWVVGGPAGTHVSWDAEITQYIPNKVLAWKSVEHSTVDNAGIIHFDPNHNGGTRVHIQLAYNPPGGALGHVIAKLFGKDPKSEMDSDLVRVKTLLETGHAAHDAAQPVKAGA